MEVDGSSKGARASHRKKSEILGSEKCILVDSGDGFDMDKEKYPPLLGVNKIRGLVPLRVFNSKMTTIRVILVAF